MANRWTRIGYWRTREREIIKLLFNIKLSRASIVFFEIKENELIYNLDQYDIQFVKNRIIIHDKSSLIILLIHFEPPKLIRIERLLASHDGVQLAVADGYFKSGNVTFYGSSMSYNGEYAIHLTT